MRINDFLKTEMLGQKMVAIKNYSEVLDRDSHKVVAYRVNISLQDETSDFFMEMIQVKVNNLNPTLSVESMSKNKATPVILENLVIGQYNGALWFSCDDVKPVSPVK